MDKNFLLPGVNYPSTCLRGAASGLDDNKPICRKIMRKSELEFKEILDNLYDGVYLVDKERRVTYWNKGAERITGYTAGQAVGQRCMDNLLNHVTESGIQLCLNGCPLHATIADGHQREAEVYLHHSDGHRVPIMVRTSPIRNNKGEIMGAVETFSDNSSLLSMRHQLRRLEDTALQDPLTGIGNRLFMERRLQIAILEFQQHSTSFGILFMDIDHFKSINDTYGHETGDKVLRMVATTLNRNLRSEDTVARWGGEEFVALLGGINTKNLSRMAEKMRTLIEHSTLWMEGKNVGVTISIGMTFIKSRDSTIQSIINRADLNMYKSKMNGANRITGDTTTPAIQ
jgi:diguanylate cyclase (GGDEF)-like protein/PAS domain S-box-containing protein